MVRLEVAFHFSSSPGSLSQAVCEALINSALRSLYGQVGSSELIYTVSDWSEDALTAAIEVEDLQDAGKVWTGLSLLSWFDSKRVKARVSANTEDLLQLFPQKPRKRR